MITGYTRPLYILPFDHRASYISGLFGWKEPLNVEQMVTAAHSKQVSHHTQHIYTRIGVSTRAGATLFAMQHNLLAAPG
jgi:5-dehydro-2-deoxygluconokinase